MWILLLFLKIFLLVCSQEVIDLRHAVKLLEVKCVGCKTSINMQLDLISLFFDKPINGNINLSNTHDDCFLDKFSNDLLFFPNENIVLKSMFNNNATSPYEKVLLDGIKYRKPLANQVDIIYISRKISKRKGNYDGDNNFEYKNGSIPSHIYYDQENYILISPCIHFKGNSTFANVKQNYKKIFITPVKKIDQKPVQVVHSYLNFQKNVASSFLDGDNYHIVVPRSNNVIDNLLSLGRSYLQKAKRTANNSNIIMPTSSVPLFIQTSQKIFSSHNLKVPNCSILDTKCSEDDKQRRANDQSLEVKHIRRLEYGLNISTSSINDIEGKIQCKNLPTSFESYTPGRISWLHREMSELGGFLIGSHDHVIGPATRRFPILVYGQESGIDADRIWFGGVHSNPFDIGEIIVLRGFAFTGNAGLFEVVSIVDNNTIAITETLPTVIRDGRVNWLANEVSSIFHQVNIFGCNGNLVQSDINYLLEVRVIDSLVNNTSSHNNKRVGLLCESLSSDSVFKTSSSIGLLRNSFSDNEIINLDDWLLYGNAGMFRIHSFNDSCWTLQDINPCEGGHLTWLTDELNTDGAIILNSNGDMIGPASIVLPISIIRSTQTLWFSELYSSSLLDVGDIILIYNMKKPGNGGVFILKSRGFSRNSFILNEIEERDISMCPFLPSTLGETSDPINLIPPIIPIDSSLDNSEELIARVRDDTCSCPKDCSDHGVCYKVNDKRRCACTCDITWGGDDCGTRYLECPKGCSGHGICGTDNGKCECDVSWGGVACDMRELSCPDHCNENIGGGLCDYESGKCTCNNGFGGINCSPHRCPSYETVDSHGYWNYTSSSCVCARAWIGTDCSIPKCGDHGRMKPDGSCSCDEGWFVPLPRSICDAHGTSMCGCLRECSYEMCNFHSSGCSSSGECICTHLWTGSFCNIPLVHIGEINQKNYAQVSNQGEFSDFDMTRLKAAYVTYVSSVSFSNRVVCHKELIEVMNCMGRSGKNNKLEWDPDASTLENFVISTFDIDVEVPSDKCFGFGEFMSLYFNPVSPFSKLIKNAIDFTFSYVDNNGDGIISPSEVANALVIRDCLNPSGIVNATYCSFPTTLKGNLTSGEMESVNTMTNLFVSPGDGKIMALLTDATFNIVLQCDVNYDGAISSKEWKDCVNAKPTLMAFPYAFHTVFDVKDRNSHLWCSEFPDDDNILDQWSICEDGASQILADYEPSDDLYNSDVDSESEDASEVDGDDSGDEDDSSGDSEGMKNKKGKKKKKKKKKRKSRKSGKHIKGKKHIDVEHVNNNQESSYGPMPVNSESEDPEQEILEETIYTFDDTTWCDMQNPFANIFCPTINPIFNILIKILIPGVIRPVIDQLQSKTLNGKKFVIMLVRFLIPPEKKRTGSSGGSFLEISEESHMLGGYEGIVPYLKKEIFKSICGAMTPSLTMEIYDRIYDPLNSQLAVLLQDSLVHHLNKTISTHLGKILHETVSRGATEAVAPLLINALTLPLHQGIEETIVPTATRSLTHSISSTLVSSLSTSPETKFKCYGCKYYGTGCEECERNGGGLKIEGANYYNDFYAAYYSDYWSDYYLNATKLSYIGDVDGFL